MKDFLKFFKYQEEKNIIKKQAIIGGISTILFVVAVAWCYMISNKINIFSSMSSENQRAMSYAQFVDGDDKVYIEGTEGTDSEQTVDNVKFSAFFLRDLDGDGYAEKLKGTCKEIGKEDTLYMEVNVQTAGYLKNGKIEINGNNYYLYI